MNKPNVSDHARLNRPVNDWFFAAIESQGTVEDSLLAVEAELNHRREFVKALRLVLRSRHLAGCDAVSELAKEVGVFENSLRFRLGVLAFDRPAAWQRPSVAQTYGPFQSSALRQPVFASYNVANIADLKQQLRACWHNRNTVLNGVMADDESLWGILLTLNKRWEMLCKLPEPYEALRLDSLPDDLPDMLHSPMLSAFIKNVGLHLKAIRLKLDECYRQLFSASEKMWRFQREQHDSRQSATYSWRDQAQSIRDELRNHRRYRSETAGRRVSIALAPKDIQALREMSLETMPTYKELRQQFLTLAKKRHPDIKGGSEEAFKNLRAAFQHLSQRVV